MAKVSKWEAQDEVALDNDEANLIETTEVVEREDRPQENNEDETQSENLDNINENTNEED